MRILLTLYSKELKSYFLSPFGWIVLTFVAAFQGFSLSTAMKVLQDTPIADSLVYIVFHTPVFWFYFLFIFPLITMRLFAEEERSGTLETLLTAPVRTSQIVLSKYLAALSFYVILWVPAFIHFQLFSTLTDIPAPFSNGSLYGAFLIIFLMGVFYTAVGCLASALTSSQIIAGIVTIFILVIHYFMGFVPVIWGENFPASGFFHYISCQEHLHSFTKGLIDTRPIVYNISMGVFILFLTHHVVDYRRWKR
jgi:ABC-2 type transport system permease protein